MRHVTQNESRRGRFIFWEIFYRDTYSAGAQDKSASNIKELARYRFRLVRTGLPGTLRRLALVPRTCHLPGKIVVPDNRKRLLVKAAESGLTEGSANK